MGSEDTTGGGVGIRVTKAVTTEKQLDRMNGTEQEYAWYLQSLLQQGEIHDWQFEPLKFRIGNDHKCTYTPDFLVVNKEGEIEIHEVKGFWQDDARVKIKCACEKFPYFRWRAIKKKPKKDGGGWDVELF